MILKKIDDLIHITEASITSLADDITTAASKGWFSNLKRGFKHGINPLKWGNIGRSHEHGIQNIISRNFAGISPEKTDTLNAFFGNKTSRGIEDSLKSNLKAQKIGTVAGGTALGAGVVGVTGEINNHFLEKPVDISTNTDVAKLAGIGAGVGLGAYGLHRALKKKDATPQN